MQSGQMFWLGSLSLSLSLSLFSPSLSLPLSFLSPACGTGTEIYVRQADMAPSCMQSIHHHHTMACMHASMTITPWACMQSIHEHHPPWLACNPSMNITPHGLHASIHGVDVLRLFLVTEGIGYSDIIIPKENWDALFFIHVENG
jgi:hypothetical protein